MQRIVIVCIKALSSRIEAAPEVVACVAEMHVRHGLTFLHQFVFLLIVQFYLWQRTQLIHVVILSLATRRRITASVAIVHFVDLVQPDVFLKFAILLVGGLLRLVSRNLQYFHIIFWPIQ